MEDDGGCVDEETQLEIEELLFQVGTRSKDSVTVDLLGDDFKQLAGNKTMDYCSPPLWEMNRRE